MFKLLILISACLCAVYAAMAIAFLEPKPEKFANQEGCYIKSLDAVIPFGKRMPSKTHCMEFLCGKDFVKMFSCSTVSVAPPCRIVSDKSKPYPDCCPRPVCDGN